MASTATTSIPQQQQQQQPQQQRSQRTLSRAPRKSAIATAASTPNLNSLYSSHSRLAPSSGALGRKASFAALTPGSLASIPDDSESYAIHSVLNESESKMAPLTPGKGGGLAGSFSLGDTVEVPGNMGGTVRFVGSVAGRKGIFAGIELHSEYATRGKNNGDVDGVSYFTTSVPGAGIFVPINKLSKRDSPSASASSLLSLTPTPTSLAGLKAASQNSTNHTPPTPSLPTFSKSVGTSRAPSPQGKRPRTSLPRPDSPVRKLQLPPVPRTGIATPAKVPPRYGSPTASKFGSSVRGTAGDPNKTSRLDRTPSLAPRSVSALGQISSNYHDDDATPVGTRTQTNGSIGSMSSMSFKRPASRATQPNEEEVERLRLQLEDRDRQLKDQASALAEMESSLSELTVLIDQSDGRMRANSLEGKDTSQLRALLREKNEKIAILTAEFDAHRADFRSTIDTLEMASTETQRVYDAKIRELEQELQESQDRNEDVDGVARQLKQLEELVQELEEGLEDARRGEAEARGEVEFLRGEVERTRTELRREREKASAVINGGAHGSDTSSTSKELEQKEDEIRGLKAIIHSLSRDSVPGSEAPDKTPTQPQRNNSFIKSRPDSIENHLAREKLEREVVELRGLIDIKNVREEELEREVEAFRRGSASTHRVSSTTLSSIDRSSYRDSKGTVILAHDARSPEATHKRAQTLDTMPESDAYSSATETSTLWCEICETSGHDILTCSNMFGPQNGQSKPTGGDRTSHKPSNSDVIRAGFKPLSLRTEAKEEHTPRPLSPITSKAATVPPPATVKILPNPQDSGPLAGKDSGVIDPEKWCALCERDGHDSIDCPLEDAF